MAQLEHGKYYHIFNRGINGTKIFVSDEDYLHFLNLYKKYIPAVADLCSFALMQNHFHLLVQIKEENEIGFFAPLDPTKDKGKWEYISEEFIEQKHVSRDGLKRPVPYRQLSHLFNAYSKWFNRKYKRTGSLFEKNFKRKEIDNEDYLKQLVYYIHHNPIHHGFSSNYENYKWTSYNDFFKEGFGLVDKTLVVEWFNDIDNFMFFHQDEHELSLIEEFITE